MEETPSLRDRIPVSIQDELRTSYLDYAMSVIIGRAIPDVRDGLKPVHRRVIYAMYDGGYRPDHGTGAPGGPGGSELPPHGSGAQAVGA